MGQVDGLEMYQELTDALNDQDKAIDSMRNAAKDMATADCEFDIALAEAVVKSRMDGEAAALCKVIALGKRNVAEAKYRKIAAEAMWKVSQEDVNNRKRRIDVMREQMNREWGRQ